MNNINIINTSHKHYLTGMTALNIPTEDGKVADWHFVDAILNKNKRLKVAGVNTVDTNDIFGSYGIRECSSVLKNRGLPLANETKVYSADFVRAILDMLYDNLEKNHTPKHIEIDELLEDHADRVEFLRQYKTLKSNITDHTKLDLLLEWENEQIF